MRDKGWDFEYFDEYCDNIFAKGHEMSKKKYNVITAFEMFEHLPNPETVIDKMFSLSDTIIFSTELIPNSRPKVLDWWYFATEHGQHVSFYTKKSLELLAKKYNKNYFQLSGLHIFTNEVLNIRKYNFLIKHRKLLNKLYKEKKSLLTSDFESLTGKKI